MSFNSTIANIFLNSKQQNYNVNNSFTNNNVNAINNSIDNLFWTFSNAYRPIHGWLSTIVCLFGIPSNLINIIVLTRPNMVKIILIYDFFLSDQKYAS